MVEVRREVLENIEIGIDSNNPKYELDYLYIDEENIVSTNTRILTIYKHNEEVKKPFFIEKSVVKKALSERKANRFILEYGAIKAYRDAEEIMSFSKRYMYGDFRFPAYERIIPNSIKVKLPFLENVQLAGIFAFQKIYINPKYFPKFKRGWIGINENNLPVVVKNDEEDITFIIMPIVDTFKEFEEEYGA